MSYYYQGHNWQRLFVMVLVVIGWWVSFSRVNSVRLNVIPSDYGISWEAWILNPRWVFKQGTITTFILYDARASRHHAVVREEQEFVEKAESKGYHRLWVFIVVNKQRKHTLLSVLTWHVGMWQVNIFITTIIAMPWTPTVSFSRMVTPEKGLQGFYSLYKLDKIIYEVDCWSFFVHIPSSHLLLSLY